MRVSRVSRGTRCTRLVAAMISSAGSPEVEAFDRPGHVEGDGPRLHAGQRLDHFGVTEIELDLAGLRELGQLPEDDARDPPAARAQQAASRSSQMRR